MDVMGRAPLLYSWARAGLVLLNVRMHRVQAGYPVPPVLLDEASSGQWFEGWKWPPPARGETLGLRDVHQRGPGC